MAKYTQIRDHLPSLYRPEAGDSGLLAIFMRAVGGVLDGLDRDLAAVMQAHWLPVADQARFDPYFLRDRAARGLGAPDPAVSDDRRAMESFPYLHDLARLGALLSLPPWREPPELRESVEAYRTRLKRFVALYRNGLGTVKALRAAVEAELPPDLEQPAEAVERSFAVEEFTPIVTVRQKAHSLGNLRDDDPQLKRLGPLMRWQVSNDGLAAAAPSVYIRAEADGGAERPMIEIFAAGKIWQTSVGIAWRGTLAKGETLRLRPACTSWLGRADGLLRAESLPTETTPAETAAAGPWTVVSGAPATAVTAICQTADHVLWVAAARAGNGELWRHDGAGWEEVLTSTPLDVVHALAERPGELMIATAIGLLLLPLYPAPGAPLAAEAVPALAGQAVHALLPEAAGSTLVGTGGGAFRLGADNSLVPLALQATPVRTIARDGDGALYFGGELGLFQYQPGLEDWYVYRGEGAADQEIDWAPLDPAALPGQNDVFLPTVTSLCAGPDASLWIGTEAGLARYIARQEDGLAYQTLLEAYPDLVDGPVGAIFPDPHGLVWFATRRGLLRFDGRDLAQYQEAAERWVPLGKAALFYPPQGPPEKRGAWRFNRGLSGGRWQRFGPAAGGWALFNGPLRSAPETAVNTVFWSDAVSADLGTWDEAGGVFTVSAAVDPAELVMRVKPSEDRIVAGGIPAVPRLPRGTTTWRYLSLEAPSPAPLPAGPAWTCEGRWLPPPAGVSAPYPGRYREGAPLALTGLSPSKVLGPPESRFDQVVFAYPAVAAVWFQWGARQPFAALVRLQRRHAGETIHPAVLDRVWQAIQRVRPAGVRVLLAVERDIVRGELS